MAERSSIEWTDRTWNPVTGCSKVSPGCAHCYAETIAHRFAGSAGFPQGFAVTLHPRRLGAPQRWRRPCRVFVNSMSDLFHPQVPDEFLARVWAVMAATPQHTYQVLTKRHARMRSLLRNPQFQREVLRLAAGRDQDSTGSGGGEPAGWWPLPNVWVGVSVEDQTRAARRVPALLDTPAAVRFLSAEPLLGPLVLEPTWLEPAPRGSGPGGAQCSPRIDWVITGGESGPRARPMHPDWARSLRDTCQDAGVPFFFKQWGHYTPLGAGQPGHPGGLVLVDPAGGTHDPRWPAPPGSVLMTGCGKSRAGRVLDGATFDEFPGGRS